MKDEIVKIGKSIIQHGNENDRIYLMKLYDDDMPEILSKMEAIANNQKYSKIFAKIPADYEDNFIKMGYYKEAFIPELYSGEKSACFMAKYLDESRLVESDASELDQILLTAQNKEKAKDIPQKVGYIFKKAAINDAKEMTGLYKKVFETYPFPIHVEDYIIKTMNENIIYFGIWDHHKLVALSSCEMDEKGQNAEMTDFAVDPNYRGDNLSLLLLDRMEQEMKRKSMKVLYTIARARSYGMNITFARMGYTYSGRLKNNTNICGCIESMNVWYKRLHHK